MERKFNSCYDLVLDLSFSQCLNINKCFCKTFIIICEIAQLRIGILLQKKTEVGKYYRRSLNERICLF